ncbi:MAG: RecX family transcriptional regulator [Proteobacteria bacterium]|nr:RecX family transcriptional regulator [Pseudomonadota bacterium]MDA0951308.1 RecX family transcriptional regulator [Pseudomonadota bacterium]
MQEKRRKRPRRITPQYLERAALHHLERYATSSENLRRVLTRKVWKAARLAEEGSAVDEEAAAAWIEAVVEKLQRAGALDDRAYAEGRVVSLRRQGESARGIAMKLGAKGVPRETVEAALELDEPENDDAAAAVAYARRRRLGPWRRPDEREERHDRDMAALARKGYRLELCRRVIEAQDVFAAEELARGED